MDKIWVMRSNFLILVKPIFGVKSIEQDARKSHCRKRGGLGLVALWVRVRVLSHLPTWISMWANY